MAGPTNSVGGYNSWEQNYNDFYSGGMTPPVASGGMLNQTQIGPTSVANSPYRAPSSAQAAAIRNVPPNSYQRPAPTPINSPNIPYGSAYTNTGDYGRASGSMLQQLMLAGQQQPLNINVRGGQQPIGSKMGNQLFGPPMAPNVPLPRPRPGYAPPAIDMAAINRPVGANPGMGGAMIGNGVMSPSIPPQGPPPPGIAPTVWAGDPPPQAPATNITVRGGQQPPRLPSSALQYAQANRAAQLAALERQSNATGTAGGYQYVGGQKVGYAPQTIGNNVYTPTNPATAYGLANAAAQIAALNRQAAATGSTGVYNYVNGVKTGTVNGQSSANAYAAANAGPGSVAAFEQKASGRPAGSYSDGREPSGTGSLW